MKRELPKNPPAIVRDAIAHACQEMDDASHGKAQAYASYSQQKWHAHRSVPQGTLDGEAADIFDWAVNFRDEVASRFVRASGMTMDAADIPSIALVSHEIVLKEVDRGIPGGRLKTTLELDFDEERLLNHHDWFDGYRVTGGGTLNTGVAIRTSLHPEMLRQIHCLIAEGQVWERVMHGLKRMVIDFKDR